MRHIILAAVAAHQVNLVFHQGNQRTNDNGYTFTDHSGQLITKTFASASRHNHKCILTARTDFDDCFLVVFESIEAKMSWSCVSNFRIVLAVGR